MSEAQGFSVLAMARRFETPANCSFRKLDASSGSRRPGTPQRRWSPPASPVTPPAEQDDEEKGDDEVPLPPSPAPAPLHGRMPPVQPQQRAMLPASFLRNTSGEGSSIDEASFVVDQHSIGRAISAPVAVNSSGGRNSGAASRQVSALNTGPALSRRQDSNFRRKTSFAHEMSKHVRSWTRRDSEDSSMASEPVSYSAQTYVSSDIWLAERKLDLVEDNIIDREEKKASRRRARAADVFSMESESQDFSSRIVRMLWANPVAHNPAANSAPHEPQSVRSRRSARGQYRVQERGHLGSGHDRSPHYVNNPAMPYSKSGTSVGAQDFTTHSGFDPSYPDSSAYAYAFGATYGRRNAVRRVLKKADVARWIRHRVNLRAERKNVL